MSAPHAAAREIRFAARRTVARDRTYLMAVLNINNDSFSGDGTIDVEANVTRAVHAVANGADLLDIGAESTRPGATPVTAEEETARLIPAVAAIRARLPEVVISIDTYKADVFAAAHRAGGDMLNVVRTLDDDLLEVAVACDAPIVITHAGATTRDADAVVDEVLTSLRRDAERAVARGLAPERIILDVGIGFGKTPDQNIALLGALEQLVALGYPTLLGASRKSTLGLLTGREVGDRVYATAATTALAAAARIDIVRVHDIAAMRDVARVCDAVVRRRG